MAPKAASVIHDDFERGFIRAEVIGYDDFIAHNGESGARNAGKLRTEGKDYLVSNGDIMHFLFNVKIEFIPLLLFPTALCRDRALWMKELQVRNRGL